MADLRRMAPYWRRAKHCARYDIARLRPRTLKIGRRFETFEDANKESRRSQEALAVFLPGNQYSAYLHECREGAYDCDKTFCPRCARAFRRYITAELLQASKEALGKIRILVVILETAAKENLINLRMARYRHFLRKRLSRAGISDTPVIGGFEMVYRARQREWVLHVNLVIFGGSRKAIDCFKEGFADPDAVREDPLNDPAEQLSYVLKFTTYHRPHQQRGATKAKAVPLNPSEHFELVQWMAQYSFSDHVFLFNARRRGASIELASKVARRA
jgi:hypothetical protein